MHSTIGRTALGIAAQKGFDEVIMTLSAKSSFIDPNRKSALDYAKETGRDDCCELLIHYDVEARAEFTLDFTLACDYAHSFKHFN